MKRSIVVILAAFILSACSGVEVPNKVRSVNEIAPYPNTAEGYTRYVINLPKLKKEDDLRVELLVGKEMNVDCNIHILPGKIKQKELVGWGYSYYEVEKSKSEGTISTLMACPESSNQNKFITMNIDINLIPYNSNLPIVVYVPDDLEVKYQLWKLSSQVLPSIVD